MATLKDVASRANVSISTVSYVLNGKKKVKEKTYNNIMQAVTDIGYVPNQVARGLRTKRSLTIGVIVPDISNEFFPEIFRGIEDVANANDYSIIMCSTDNDVIREKKYISTLISKDIDGIIFIGTGKSQDIFDVNIKLPIVLVDRKFGEQFMSVTIDNYKGGYLATEHLIQQGYKSIALLAGPLYIKNFFDRMHGYIDALADNGINYNDQLVYECKDTSAEGYSVAMKILKKHNIDAIFASNDLIAFGAIRAASEMGKKIPIDIGIVGYDDISLASVIIPSLTTIRQPKYEIGKTSAELVLEQISNEDIKCRNIEFEPTLVVRETTRNSNLAKV